MPEGPEIRLAADKIARVLVDKPIESFFLGLPDLARWEEEFASSYVISIETRRVKPC